MRLWTLRDYADYIVDYEIEIVEIVGTLLTMLNYLSRWVRLDR